MPLIQLPVVVPPLEGACLRKQIPGDGELGLSQGLPATGTLGGGVSETVPCSDGLCVIQTRLTKNHLFLFGVAFRVGLVSLFFSRPI